MKKTNKILLMVLILVVTLSFGIMHNSYADEVDDDGYVDLNASEPAETTEETPQTTTTPTPSTTDTKTESDADDKKTNTENVTSKVLNDAKTTNATNTTTKANNTANPTNAATTPAPQTGDFLDAKIIGAALVAVAAVVIAFAKLKKYSY